MTEDEFLLGETCQGYRRGIGQHMVMRQDNHTIFVNQWFDRETFSVIDR